METGLGWLGIGVGAAGFVATYLMAAASAGRVEPPGVADDRRTAWMSAGLTAIITVVFWAISMRKALPFSPGQTLGFGFLIGGLFAAKACLLSFRFGAMASAGSDRTGRLGACSMAFLGLLATSLVYLIFHGNPRDALIGFAIGVTTGAIIRYFHSGLRSPQPDHMMRAWAVFTITTAISIVLAVGHFDQQQLRMWWPAPILLAATVCLANFIGIEVGFWHRFRERMGMSYAHAALIASVLVIGLAAIYSWRLLRTWQLLEVAIGIAFAAVLTWLSASYARNKGAEGALDAGAASVLLVIGFFVATFKLWSGLGIGLGLIAAWAVVLPALSPGRKDEAEDDGTLPRMLTSAMLLGLAVLLFRQFVENYRSQLGTTDLRTHYMFVGALLGVVLPFVFASSRIRIKQITGGTCDCWALAGVAALGLVAAAAPLVLIVVWGIKALLGFVFGLVAASAFLMVTQPLEDGPVSKSGLMMIGAMLVAIQFAGPLSGDEITRVTRAIVLAAAVVIAVMWFAITGALAGRWQQ